MYYHISVLLLCMLTFASPNGCVCGPGFVFESKGLVQYTMLLSNSFLQCEVASPSPRLHMLCISICPV
jgi:hypothetical protein